MAQADVSHVAVNSSRLNVADRLATFAARSPDAIAVAAAGRRSKPYSTISFGELDADATRIARGLADWGVAPGTRLVLLVRPSVDFVALVFALLRAGVVMVLVDPGLGRRNAVRCLSDAEPEGFVAIPQAQMIRALMRGKFLRAKWNVTVGRRWFWGGTTLAELRERGDRAYSTRLPDPRPDDAAAVIFTSGSTGAPKGVLYTQRMFATQVDEIRSTYGIQPGGVDLSCFPLFALFNSAMGVTTVLPDMDFSRPTSVDPQKLIDTANEWKVTQAFASPAVWRKLGAHCAKSGGRIPTLREVFSCGAPVPSDVLTSTLAIAASDAKMHTPYGATECLPVATIEGGEVLRETARRTDAGAGVCVGRPFGTIEWRIIRISDEPIARLKEIEELPAGEIGELIVRGPQVSPRYVTRTEANAAGKIVDGDAVWHRVGDVGYLDESERFWYCGRKSQRVETAAGPMFTECVEAVFKTHPAVARSALVGVGPSGRQTPVVICQPTGEIMYCGGRPVSKHNDHRLVRELRELAASHELTRGIEHFRLRNSLPVDIRHNSKINREALAIWAARQFPELA